MGLDFEFLIQLEDTLKAGEKPKEEDHENDPDIEAEDNAIEMSEDMQGKMHDMEENGKLMCLFLYFW